ncbi:MAG: plasmid mobilization relaxosome protein MobC [Oscillospiraceae bacterium]|nr:plasmid mobilization relaxosome protein MobC [Oscillospiraceae bacterium]
MTNGKKQVIFRLEHDEHKRLTRKIKKSGMSQNAYLRHLIKSLIPTDMPPPDYFSMMRVLNGIGSKLDQIVQQAKLQGSIDIERYIKVVAELDCAIIDITNAVMLPRDMSR